MDRNTQITYVNGIATEIRPRRQSVTRILTHIGMLLGGQTTL